MASSLASRLTSRLQLALENVRLHALPESEKKAVLVLCHGVALADGELAAHEQEALEALAKRVGVDSHAMTSLSLEAAVEHLATQPKALRLACLVVADAVFADGDYDDAEQKFVASFQERFKLPGNPLRDAVEALRKHKLDAALSEWNESIRAG
jgi:uncharacterized tellurite resistance protein B-like protein